MYISFIINSRMRQLESFKKELEVIKKEFGEEAGFYYTEYRGHASEYAEKLAEKSDFMIAVGGDGTLNEIINGLMEANLSSDHTIPAVGLLPYGTANDFSKTIKATRDIQRLIELIKDNSTMDIDIGEITWFDDQKEKTKYFINIADVGLGAEVVKKVNRGNNIISPTFTFLSAITRSFITYKKEIVACRADNFEWKGLLMALVVANGRYFGSGLCIAPSASVSDGYMEVVIIGNISFVEYLLNIGKIRKGIKIDHPEIRYHKCKFLEILPELTHTPFWECDGEFGSKIPIRINALKQEVPFLADNE